MIEQSLSELSNHPDYQILKRIPMELKGKNISSESKVFMTTIIDLETMGMDATQHEIIEIGMLSFLFSNEDGILAVKYTIMSLTIRSSQSR